MSYIVKHKYADIKTGLSISMNGDKATVHCSASGEMPIRFPGKLQIFRSIRYNFHLFVEPPPGPQGQPPHPGRWNIESRVLPTTVEIRTPDGQLFTADHITLNDLKKFRDLRGASQGSWTYIIHGESEPILIIPHETRVTVGSSYASITVEETVTSKSARPFIDETLATPGNQRYTFDLYRVGTFTATAKSMNPFFSAQRPMKLIDPDGTVVANSNNGRLTYNVTLRTLNKSRDGDGNARPWSLDVLPSAVPSGSSPFAIWASVINTSTVHTSVLQKRIDTLIGTNGNKLSIYGEMDDLYLLGRLKILDEVSAETIDILKLLDSVIESVTQDAGVDTKNINIEKGVAYTLAHYDRRLDYGFHASLKDNAKINAIKITVGASEKIQPTIPALKIAVEVQGYIAIDFAGIPLATAKIRGNRIQMEAGLSLNAEGVFALKSWISDDIMDVDVNWSTALVAALISAGIFGVGAVVAGEVIESYFNSKITNSFKDVVTSAMEKAPEVLAMMHGDDFTYQSLRLVGDDIVIDYIAPKEPDPKPTKGYTGLIGRSATEFAPGNWQIIPHNLGDTWKADNLAKIDHIVVVMMENRSFDHVLGYRAQLPGHGDSDGLTTELVNFLNTINHDGKHYPVSRLKDSGIAPNSQHLKTKFPASVGHHFEDVAEQLSEKITTTIGRTINHPKGFLSNFKSSQVDHQELKLNDVLGYYDGNDLPFFKFLAENYSYCEQFYCSHPGPTLPNRMFSLTGDLQYDRTGEAILNNSNIEGNIYLSRAMTIYDMLTRKGIKWRVYESFPSVTMLRMFTRYSTDNTNIVNIDRFKQDVAEGNLPAVTIVDPAMHHYPENDDHAPHADMYSGQLFLKDVYDTLRSNDALWRKTMFIITYDEHGGFYDHVIPPTADLRVRENASPPTTIVGSHPIEEADPDSPHVSGSFGPSSLKTNYGVRVPTFVVSPWTTAGKGPNIVLDHCSILKTILARFCGQDKPFFSDRVNASFSFNAYMSETQSRMNVPASPTMPPLVVAALHQGESIITEPISRKQLQSGHVDYHDLTGMLGRLLGR